MKDEPEVYMTEGSVYNFIYADNPELAEDMRVKSELVMQIQEIKQHRGLTQGQLGELIKMDQAQVSRMLNGNFRKLSIGRIMLCLRYLNRDVRIVVERHPVRDEIGTFGVMAGLNIIDSNSSKTKVIGNSDGISGRNETYKTGSLKAGTRTTSVKEVKLGQHSGVHVVKVQGKEYLRANPDHSKSNNVNQAKKKVPRTYLHQKR